MLPAKYTLTAGLSGASSDTQQFWLKLENDGTQDFYSRNLYNSDKLHFKVAFIFSRNIMRSDFEELKWMWIVNNLKSKLRIFERHKATTDKYLFTIQLSAWIGTRAKVVMETVDTWGIGIQFFGGERDDVIGKKILLNRLRLKIFSEIKIQFHYKNLSQILTFTKYIFWSIDFTGSCLSNHRVP